MKVTRVTTRTPSLQSESVTNHSLIRRQVSLSLHLLQLPLKPRTNKQENDSKTVQRSALCRSRRELSNAYFVAKFGFDTAENEPYQVSRRRAARAPAGRGAPRGPPVVPLLAAPTPAALTWAVRLEIYDWKGRAGIFFSLPTFRFFLPICNFLKIHGKLLSINFCRMR